MAPAGSVVVTMENPNNFAVVELEVEKERTKNKKQFTWLVLLKLHMAISLLSRSLLGLRKLLSTAQKRVLSLGKRQRMGRLLVLLRAFLAVSFAALLLEIYAHKSELHLMEAAEVRGWVQEAYLAWLWFRAAYVAPLIVSISRFCIVLFLIQSVDRFALCLGCFWVKFRKMKPRFEKDDDASASYYPMVLVQIPMCNESEVYEQSISAACQLDWPKEKMLIQVLDDSDIKSVQILIRNEVNLWRQKGANIVYRHRFFRTGYKAGNLQSAMSCDYVKDYEFVAIFDADFQPNPDFLKLTVPHFKDNPELGLVQARWSFVNKDENLLTRLQNINLAFHFEVEQQVNGVFLNFFGFNGTAGVWRIKALEDSGGWLERTTVEDMDIAVRAHLHGWKFIFLNDVKALCELPESYEAYKKQQYRWHSGPMQLFKLCLPAIISAKIPAWKKFNLIFLFFLLRKLILPFYSFTLFCVILPLTMFVPEAELPLWVICYIPVATSILNILPSPKSFPFLIPYLLFENTMSVTKFNAMISGLFQLGSSYEWVVTKKTGRASESDLLGLKEKADAEQQDIHLQKQVSESDLESLIEMEDETVTEKKKGGRNRVYRKEMVLACLLLTAAARSLLSAQGVHFYFLLFQGISFLVVGLDLIGEQAS
ncbi:hypothetical protein Cni_G20904 [Canna indica]|uniref:Glycosyltransferase 2-like domain-containing protein n=1 Tax=Canna indica TaxID=4628 RepID=A0AAQ3KPS4_9LILI|nr:hypothetical protein Cni_G20904 [Canna indica]